MPFEKRPCGYLYEGLTGLPKTVEVSIDCISVSETVAEKVLSLLRRCACKWRGYQGAEMDRALVRHVYDVAQIVQSASSTLGPAREIFAALVAKDREEFEGQNPEFDADPVKVLRETLEQARTHSELQARYEDTLMPLVCGSSAPSYVQAFSLFKDVALDFLSSCEAGEAVRVT